MSSNIVISEDDIAVAQTPEGWVVTLLSKPVKTADGSALIVPTEALAHAIADEWRAQELPKINTGSMPLYRIACMAIDYVRTQRSMVEEELCRFAQSDTLCYQVEYPEGLATQQMAEWQPLVKWAGSELGASFHITCTVTPLPHDDALHAAVQTYISPFDDYTLAALLHAARVATSLIIALAVKAQHVDGETAWHLAYMEELYQRGEWGEDEEATAKLDVARAELCAAAHFFTFCTA